jgi:hydroxymethylpyrimidine/phosphomethylpyrimidine kinase
MDNRLLIVAGSDSGGGAGIQADIKTAAAFGCYASTAVTAITVQNTLGVSDVCDVPESVIVGQIQAVLEDIGADVIKTGMLSNTRTIKVISEILSSYEDIPLVVDPVMVAKDGTPLLEKDAVDVLKQTLFSQAYLITPNIPEAEYLTDMVIDSKERMMDVALVLKQGGAQNVLLKGGHLGGDIIYDVLVLSDESVHVFEHPRIETENTHGTGCTLASAIACGIASKKSLYASINGAIAYVERAIKGAPNIGQGQGPLNHYVTSNKTAA